MQRLTDKIAVVTGGCSGIGLGTVELFVSEGAKVVVGDVQDTVGRELEAKYPGRVKFKHCDVTQEAEIRSLMEFAAAEFGGIDVLFNNAGAGGSPARIDEIDGAGWDRTQSLLLKSVALGMRYAVPFMKQRGGGAIVNTASVAGLIAGAAPVAYSAAKAGVLQLTKVAAAQLAAFNIRVNAICPGFIVTNIFSAAVPSGTVPPETLRAALKQISSTTQPIARGGLPQDIANACLFLSSSESSYVTGTHLVVDGGLTVGPRQSWDPSVPTVGASLQSILKT